MSRVPILVGEQNQISNDRKFDLYPLPTNSTGGRLCREILGMKLTDYLRHFERRNLLGTGPWKYREATQVATQLLKERPDGRFVLLGARVCAAFGRVDLRDFQDGPLAGGAWALRLPHPSGRCRVWNDQESFVRARLALRTFLPAPAADLIGSADRASGVAIPLLNRD